MTARWTLVDSADKILDKASPTSGGISGTTSSLRRSRVNPRCRNLHLVRGLDGSCRIWTLLGAVIQEAVMGPTCALND